MKISKLKEKMSHLVSLYQAKQDATDDLKEAIDAAATECEIDKAALSKLVRAEARDKVQETRKYASDLQLALFEFFGGEPEPAGVQKLRKEIADGTVSIEVSRSEARH